MVVKLGRDQFSSSRDNIMLTIEKLETALRSALPNDATSLIPFLSKILFDFTNNNESSIVKELENNKQQLVNGLHTLSGKTASSDEAILLFGTGNQLGDVTIHDLAGNNIIKININFFSGSSEHQASFDSNSLHSSIKFRATKLAYTAIDRVSLRNVLAKHYNNDEISDVCFELGIDPEDIAGNSKSARVRELISYTERYGLYQELIKKLVLARPFLFEERCVYYDQ